MSSQGDSTAAMKKQALDEPAKTAVIICDDKGQPTTSDRANDIPEGGDRMQQFMTANQPLIHKVLKVCGLLAFAGYFLAAVIMDFKRATGLFVLTLIVVLYQAYRFLRNRYADAFYNNVFVPAGDWVDSRWNIMRWVVYGSLLAAMIIFMIADMRGEAERLWSAVGLVFYVALQWLFSWHRSKINWRPVMWGLGLQFLGGLLVLRWSVGYKALEWLGDNVSRFLDYVKVGVEFVFGEKYYDHYFAFAVIPTVIFFAAVMSVLYYYGVMQWLIKKVSWAMEFTMKTSPTESLSCGANIFVGQTEAPLMVKPFLKDMTRSELHAVMTGGFATIAGGVLAAYIGFGIPATHLIAASVMSAPAALACSKIVYPETEESPTKPGEKFPMPESSASNGIEAAASGTAEAVQLALNIGAMLISFLSLLAFFNNFLQWVGWNVGIEGMTFQKICSVILRPLAFIMGVPWKDAGRVGQLIGVKTFLNEFVAYLDLSTMIKNGEIGERGILIATYCLCGFSNLGSIGIQLGGLTPMAPNRAKDLSEIALSAMLTGTVACFMTACVAGMLTPIGLA